jgi:hypothetical protein
MQKAECHGEPVLSQNRCNRAKIPHVKSQLITLIMILAIGLQGSLTAFALGHRAMQSDCQTSADSQDIAQKSCCPSGLHSVGCCLDACVAVIAIATSPVSLAWYGRAALPAQLRISTFFSRGDSPLIRPPIL